MLTAEQRESFERDGVICLRGAFSAAEAARMRDVVWEELRRRHGIERDERTTWDLHAPTGLKSSKKNRAFAPTFGPPVRAALDDLLGAGQWHEPKHYGQVLVTMPNASEWRVPHRIWHGDFQYGFAPDSLPMVKLWALFADHGPGAGATPQLVGSHRLVARYLEDRTGPQLEYKRVKHGFLSSDPWLKELTADDDAPDRTYRFMHEGCEIDGVHVRVVECTGAAGDVYITHPWLMHSIAVNASPEPRMMRSAAVYRYDYLAVLSRAGAEPNDP